MAYTDKQKAEVIAILESNNGNVTGTLKELKASSAYKKISKNTLLKWRNILRGSENCTQKRESIENELPKARFDLVQGIEGLLPECIETIRKKLPEATAKEAAVILGILVEKYQVSNNMPTQIQKITINKPLSEMTFEEKASLYNELPSFN